MEKAMNVGEAIMLMGIIMGGIVCLALLIALITYVTRKVYKKEVTTVGTDKSVFAKHIMNEYYEEKSKNNGL